MERFSENKTDDLGSPNVNLNYIWGRWSLNNKYLLWQKHMAQSFSSAVFTPSRYVCVYKCVEQARDRVSAVLPGINNEMSLWTMRRVRSTGNPGRPLSPRWVRALCWVLNCLVLRTVRGRPCPRPPSSHVGAWGWQLGRLRSRRAALENPLSLLPKGVGFATVLSGFFGGKGRETHRDSSWGRCRLSEWIYLAHE